MSLVLLPRRVLPFVLIYLALAGGTVIGQRTRHMRVILDKETFGASAVSLQPVADRVASEVDNLIPGTPSEYPEDGIICFEAEGSWNSDPSHPAPITVIGPKLLGEPAATSGNTIRIALNAVKPADVRRLSYQLSHELAHVKMGVRADNY